MNSFSQFVGIDVASATFTAAIFTNPETPCQLTDAFGNSIGGFEAFQKWLASHHIDKKRSLFCMEATGVYSEALCYWLYANDFKVVLEMPLKVKRAFKIKGHKTDAVDAAQIAEYAYRFKDKLKLWQPKSDIIEQLRTLLTTREQLLGQKVASTNALKSLRRKFIQSKLAVTCLENNINHFKLQIKQMFMLPKVANNTVKL